jgi:hypothetical protein
VDEEARELGTTVEAGRGRGVSVDDSRSSLTSGDAAASSRTMS